MSDTTRAPIVAVLAGGRGERLGGNKPAVPLAGRPLIAYPLDAAREAGLEAVVVAKRDSLLPRIEERVIYDNERGYHPLAGVLAALRERQTVIAVACDMPFVNSSLLRWIAEQHATAVVTRPGNFLQPFPALYSARHVRSLQASLMTQRSLQESIERLRPQIVDDRDLRAFGPQVRLFFSINTPTDLKAAESWLTAPASV
jgi:molybdenum cofactor guanylyltransferase